MCLAINMDEHVGSTPRMDNNIFTQIGFVVLVGLV